VGLHALDRVHARAGETVVVLGFGPIGACTAVVAAAMGLEVLVSEPGEERRERAASLGFAVHEPAGERRDVTRAVRALTGGGAQIVVDASGVPAALEAAPDMTRRGGSIAVVGLPKRPPEIDAARLVLYERSLIGSLGYANDLPRVAAMIAAGRLDAERLITKVVPLAETPEELQRLAEQPGGDIKVLVDVNA
jgi:(R,R)-butanediol dehydrogenase/meso-butanediol dehydrogenase/diacetyl reductase